jgi:hypothetical protein
VGENFKTLSAPSAPNLVLEDSMVEIYAIDFSESTQIIFQFDRDAAKRKQNQAE